MSATYRLFVCGVTPAIAAAALSRSNLETLISPVENALLMVLSPDFEIPIGSEEEVVASMAGGLSQMIAAPVLAMIELPKDALDLRLFQAGDETDRYGFAPERRAEVRGGSASHLATALGRPGTALAIEQALRAEANDANAIGNGIAESLGFPAWWHDLTYNQLDQHLDDPTPPWTERPFLRTP